ncbi:hypothetical protein M0R45_010041 [Rubus argutus]|uniref:Uncharacterized protein n=1 Tax=Rubus argutus TaxID=59490 RepID=A0AAW1Y8D6_RUBAR
MGSNPMVNGNDDFLLNDISIGWREWRLTLVDLLVWLFPSNSGTNGDKVVGGGACWGLPRLADWLWLDGSGSGTHDVDGGASVMARVSFSWAWTLVSNLGLGLSLVY